MSRQSYEQTFLRSTLQGLPLLTLRRGFVVAGARLITTPATTTAEVELVSESLGRRYLLRRDIWPHDPTIDAAFASMTFTTGVQEWTDAHDTVFPPSTLDEPAVVWA
jgi:hypothetical protein